MKALVLHAAGDARIEDRPDPAAAWSRRRARCACVRAGLCGTDASEYAAGPVMTPAAAPAPEQRTYWDRSCSVTSSSASSRTTGEAVDRVSGR